MWGVTMMKQSNNRDELGAQNDLRKSYQPPKLVKLSQEQTESGPVILPIEILGVQGPS
jgi:hypothetical protein